MKIVVIGSLNVDHMIKLRRLPLSGETIHGLRQFKFPGGKGLNQAAALSRLGNEVQLIGMIGHDDDGIFLLEELHNENIDSTFIKRCRNEKTGNSFILVDENGNNIIVVLHGANNKLDTKYIDEHKSLQFDIKRRNRTELIELIVALDQRCRKLHEYNQKLEAENQQLQNTSSNSDYTKCSDEIQIYYEDRNDVFQCEIIKILKKHFA